MADSNIGDEEEALKVKTADRTALKAKKKAEKEERAKNSHAKKSTASPEEGLASNKRLASYLALLRDTIKALGLDDPKTVEDLKSLSERFKSLELTITKIQLQEIWYVQLGNIINMISNEKMKNDAKEISNKFKTKQK